MPMTPLSLSLPTVLLGLAYVRRSGQKRAQRLERGLWRFGVASFEFINSSSQKNPSSQVKTKRGENPADRPHSDWAIDLLG